MGQRSESPIERVHARIDELPMFPGIAVRVLSLVRDPKHSIAQVAKCIEADPALATRVLALANSALFSPRRPIGTLAHATLYIGERALTGAVVAASVEQFYAKDRVKRAPEEISLWRHSLAVAAIARNLSRRVGLDADRALALGLLHDVGLLYLRTETDALAAEIVAARESGLSRREAEIATFGSDHAVLGGALLTSFGLPADLAHGVMLHHEPEADAPATEEDCVHVADCIAANAGLAPREEIPGETPSSFVLSRLALDDDTLKLATDQANEELAELEQTLGV